MAMMSVAASLYGQSGPQKILVGDAKVTVIQSYQGDPLPKPQGAMIFDFAVSPDVVTMDKSVSARMHQRRERLTGSNPDATPEQVAQSVQTTFSDKLQTDLQKAGIAAQLAPTATSPVAPHTLEVRGEFTSVDQGNRTKRIVVGFGRGASDVKAHVRLLLITDTEPIVVSEFELKSESGKKPGAAETAGVGSAAAGAAVGSAGDRKATVDSDTERMANAVAKQIEQVMIAQKWISGPTAAAAGR